ncbi:MAG: ABC transporter ATP-binding protein [Acidiferrobacterales bacterium]
MSEAPLIRVEDIRKEYHTGAALAVPVLRGVDLTISSGEFVAIMGPSGSGKSTFMNILGCLDVPTSGHYFLNGGDVALLGVNELARLRNRQFGFVFQGFNLLPRIDARDNVALPLLYSGMGRRQRRARAQELIEQVGLAGVSHHLPNQLSGGQQQRVAIARALANQPQLILADEPTGNLDTKMSQEIMDLFTNLNIARGITIVLVTHELDIARYARRLVKFVDGLIVQDGATHELLAAEPT